VQIRREEIEREFDCLGVDGIAVDAITITACSSDEYTSDRSAGPKENKVTRVRKHFQCCPRDCLAESLGAGRRRRDLVGRARDDRNRYRDLAEALRYEDRARPRCHREDGANTLIAI